MFRLIATIIIFITVRILGGYRYSSGYSYNNGTYPYIYISDWLQMIIKRHIVLYRRKKYISKYLNSYSLRNRNVVLNFNKKHLTITCMNIKNRKKNFKVSWEDYKYKNNIYDAISDSSIKIFFNETFNQVCIHFNENATYEMILDMFQDDYNVEITDTEKKQVNQTKKETPLYVDEYFSGNNAPKKLIDINTASLDEIKSLPGINIALAKRIIQYREKHNGFKTIDEFYSEFNIKPHFRKQINELIILFNATPNPEASSNSYFGETMYNKEEEKNPESKEIKTNSDRIIDI